MKLDLTQLITAADKAAAQAKQQARAKLCRPTQPRVTRPFTQAR